MVGGVVPLTPRIHAAVIFEGPDLVDLRRIAPRLVVARAQVVDRPRCFHAPAAPLLRPQVEIVCADRIVGERAAPAFVIAAIDGVDLDPGVRRIFRTRIGAQEFVQLDRRARTLRSHERALIRLPQSVETSAGINEVRATRPVANEHFEAFDTIRRPCLLPLRLFLRGEARRRQHGTAAIGLGRMCAPGKAGEEALITFLGIDLLRGGVAGRLHRHQLVDAALRGDDVRAIRVYADILGVGRGRIQPGRLAPVHLHDFLGRRPKLAGAQKSKRRNSGGQPDHRAVLQIGACSAHGSVLPSLVIIAAIMNGSRMENAGLYFRLATRPLNQSLIPRPNAAAAFQMSVDFAQPSTVSRRPITQVIRRLNQPMRISGS